MRKAFLLLVILSALGGAGAYYWHGARGPAFDYRTAPAKRGELLITIGATGTVEPLEVVDVGAQVAGKIVKIGDPDHPEKIIDYGTQVEEKTVLAKIDDALYVADLAQANAQLEQARTNKKKAEADLLQMEAKLDQARNNWNRAQQLGPSKALSQSEYDNYEAAFKTADATLAVGKATIDQCAAAILQAEAFYNRSNTNLNYCTITSPVKGVIIDRRVNPGQTVVASLNAPSLFLIAKDLTKMQVWVAVNEADIGSIHPGQPVGFTVDAYPNCGFRGEVGKIRLNATMTQNVVTYTVEVNTDNSDGKLLPYLTANVDFEVDRRKDVLTVPNAALRWKPDPPQIAPDIRAEVLAEDQRKSVGGPRSGSPGGAGNPEAGPRSGSGARSGGPAGNAGPGAAGKERKRPASRPAGGASPAAPSRGRVWVRDGDFVRPVKVTLGPSDNTNTEIHTEALKDGDEVIVGDIDLSAGEQTTNPFTPRFFGGRRG